MTDTDTDIDARIDTGITPVRPVLEPAAQAFAEATANPPYLFDLGPVEGRKVVDEVQSGDIAKPTVEEEWVTVAGGPTGEVRARIVRPAGADGVLPAAPSKSLPPHARPRSFFR